MDPSGSGLLGASSRMAALGAAAFIAVILTSLFRVPTLPWIVPAGVLGFAVFSAARPAGALLAIAVLSPIAAYFGAHADRMVAWPEVLVLTFLAGWLGRHAFQPFDVRLSRPIRLPASIFAVLVLAALVVDFIVLFGRVGMADGLAALGRYFFENYFLAGPGEPAARAGALLLEGVALFWAAAQAAEAHPRLRRSVAIALVVGGAAAAGITLMELASASLQQERFWTSLTTYVATVRFNPHYGDLNAAGSYYAMMLLVSCGLLWSHHRLAWWWTVPVVLIAGGLWVSGSRTALLACPLVVVAMLGVRLGARKPLVTAGRLVFAAAVAAALAGVLALLLYAPHRSAQAAPSIAAGIRLEFAATTARMLRDRPVFGIGLGQFAQRSGEFSSPELLAMFPAAENENAHNNFLQIAGELGLTGFAVFLWLLAAALLTRPRGERDGITLHYACLAGALVFLLTCLGGHPLLIREPGYAFWTLLGIVASWRPALSPEPDAPGASARRAPYALAIVVAIVAGSIPLRSQSHLREANLEHLGIGFTLWQTSPDGVRYREAIGEGTIFVPNGLGFHIRMRPISEAPVNLEMSLDGRLADVLVLAADRWNDITIPLRDDPSLGRFIRIDLRVQGGRAVPLWVTKVQPVGGQ